MQIASEVKARSEIGKDSEVTIDGMIVPAKKLKKEIQRYCRDLKVPLNEGTV